MNSVIISFICSFFCSIWRGFCKVLYKSKIWGIIERVYSLFQKSFKKSVFKSFVEYETDVNFRKTSLFYKIFRLPVFFISFMCEKLSRLIRYFADKSITSAVCRGFYNGFLALDVKFIGILLSASGIGWFLSSFLKLDFNLTALILVLAGFVLSFIKMRLAYYLDGSAIVKTFKKSIGIENQSFKLYKKSSYVYFSAVIIGLISGIMASLNTVLILFPFALFMLIAVITHPLCGVYLAVFFGPILPTMAVVGICVLTTLSSLAHKAYNGDYKIKIGRVGVCLIFLLLIMAVSTATSYGVMGSVGVFGMYLIFITFYFTLVNEIKSKKILNNCIKMFIMSAAVVSVYGILQGIFGWTTDNAWIDETMFEESTMRVYSTLANPNVLGEYLLLALPLSALAFLKIAKTTFEKIVYVAFFGLSLLCLVLTQSRGCWIGFFVTAFLFITYYKSAMWKLIPFGILILPFVLPQTIIDRLLSVGDLGDSSTSYRVYIWLGTLEMLKTFWIGGIGLGEKAFGAVYPMYSYEAIVAPHSHNLYLQLIVESGICALLVFITAIIMYMKKLINIMKTDRKTGLYAITFISAVAGFLVQSMFDYTFYNYRVMGLFFMVLAFGKAVGEVLKKEEVSVDKGN